MHSVATAAPAANIPAIHGQPARKSAYNPRAIERRVRLAEATTDNVVIFKSYSFTRPGHDVKHCPSVDLNTGAVFCNCEQFTYRLAKHNPTIFSGEICKHLRRAVANLAERRLLPQQQTGQYAPTCINCNAPDARFEVCDHSGNLIPGQFLCTDCIEARYDDLADAAPHYFAEDDVWDAESRLSAPVPPHIDSLTGAIRDGWFQVVTPVGDLQAGQWVTQAVVDAARPVLSAAVVAMMDIFD